MSNDKSTPANNEKKIDNGTLNVNLGNDEQTSLDSLLYDNPDEDISKETAEDAAMYEAFFADYKSVMAKTLASVKEASVTPSEDGNEADDSEFLISLPKSKDKKTSSENPEKWDEDITLAPAEYEDLSEDAEIFNSPEEEIVPDFNLGQPIEKKTDKFQISFSFDGEESQDTDSVEEIKPEEKYDPEKPRIIDWAFEFVELFVISLMAVMILTTFLFKHSVVDGPSMNNTLNHGEHLIISDIFYTPERGDIIVFEDYSIPDEKLNKPIVKRIIGLPGETIKIVTNRNGTLSVYVDDVLLEEDYAYYDPNLNYSVGTVKTWTLGENEVFVMGDNRRNSTDSRYEEVGPIDIDCILGKVLFRFAPLDKFGKVE